MMIAFSLCSRLAGMPKRDGAVPILTNRHRYHEGQENLLRCELLDLLRACVAAGHDVHTYLSTNKTERHQLTRCSSSAACMARAGSCCACRPYSTLSLLIVICLSVQKRLQRTCSTSKREGMLYTLASHVRGGIKNPVQMHARSALFCLRCRSIRDFFVRTHERMSNRSCKRREGSPAEQDEPLTDARQNARPVQSTFMQPTDRCAS